MKQYRYKPEQAGLAQWPSGELRLTCETTENPQEADVFVYPGGLHGVSAEQITRLPYFKGNEARHVFFHVSDEETQYHQPSIFLRCNLRPWNLVSDPNSVAMAWPVEDYSECIEPPTGGFKYDVSFQGWLSTPTRNDSTNACKNDHRVKSDIAQYSDFTGYLKPDNPEYHRRRAEFRRSMKESRIALCPESIPGVFPYRFFEAMSAGRVALLVGSDFVFPFADLIDYSSFTIFCPRNDAEFVNTFVLRAIDKWSDKDFIELGKLARFAWESLLDCRAWPTLHTYAVERQLAKIAC